MPILETGRSVNRDQRQIWVLSDAVFSQMLLADAVARSWWQVIVSGAVDR